MVSGNFTYLSGMKRTLFMLMAIALMAPSCKKCYTCKAAIYSNGVRYGSGYADPASMPNGEADYHDVCGKDKDQWERRITFDDTIVSDRIQLIYECIEK